MNWDNIGVSDSELFDVSSDALAWGHPTWPYGYQRYRIVRTWQSLIFSSEGLGAVELYLEMPGAQGWLPEQLRNQWHFDVLSAACRVLVSADWPPAPFVLSLPAPPSAPPQMYAEVGETVVLNVIVGMEVPGRPSLSALPLTPITALEWAFVRDGGPLSQITDARVEMGFHHVVVDAEEVTSLLDARLSN